MAPKKQGRPATGRPATKLDHHHAAGTILACAEPWVIEERRRLEDARSLKRAWASALGLRVVDRMSMAEIRRVAAFQRMLDDADDAHTVVRNYGAA